MGHTDQVLSLEFLNEDTVATGSINQPILQILYG